MDSLYGFELSKILSPSISEDKGLQAIARALNPELQNVSHDIREALIYSRIDELSEPVVDLLAWQWHVDFYELARTLEMKRAMVKDSIPWHRKKGTRWAILKALDMLGIRGTFTPWWEIEGAKPYTFAIEAEITSGFWSQTPNVEDATKVIRRAIEESKAARSWLVKLDTVIKNEVAYSLYTGIATCRGGRQKIWPEAPEYAPSVITTGIGTYRGGKSVIEPSRPQPSPVRLYAGGATLLSGSYIIRPHEGQGGTHG